ncbi:MAG: MaoC/PaaZ C-terminal domain-containing protein [Chloroflexota bacterium]|nr:MaoC/PaaZ C-terminal domain-containing protein [Chloroflexota bacterium]
MKTRKQIYFQDVKIGQIIGPKIINIDRKQLVMYAGASQDFNEFHYDDEVAKKAGHKGIIIHGALKSAWLAQLMVEFVGLKGRLKKFNVSYRGVDFPYEDLKYYGKITNKYIDKSIGFVEIDLSLENAEGQITTPSSALIELPMK